VDERPSRRIARERHVQRSARPTSASTTSRPALPLFGRPCRTGARDERRPNSVDSGRASLRGPACPSDSGRRASRPRADSTRSRRSRAARQTGKTSALHLARQDSSTAAASR
jgi:hypothetical protein